MTFELFERVSSGDLTVFDEVNKDDDNYLPLLYAIPETIKCKEIQQHITHLDPLWLVNRGLAVEQQTGDIEDSISLFTLSDHPLAEQLLQEFNCFKHILGYFEERGLLTRKLTFEKLSSELARLPLVEKQSLTVYLAQRKECNLQLLLDSFNSNPIHDQNIELMEEIFG